MPIFKIIHGRHVGFDPEHAKQVAEENKKRPPDKQLSPKERVYGAGEQIEAEGYEAEILARDSEKFQLLRDDGTDPRILQDNNALREENERLKRQLSAFAQRKMVDESETLGVDSDSSPLPPGGLSKDETSTDRPSITKPLSPNDAAASAAKSPNLPTGHSAEKEDEEKPEKAKPQQNPVQLRAKLERMSAAQLQKYAEDEEMSLTGAHNKEEMIRTILAQSTKR